jgi:hypothetical protein
MMVNLMHPDTILVYVGDIMPSNRNMGNRNMNQSSNDTMNENMALEAIRNEIEYHEDQLDRLQQAADLLEEGDFSGGVTGGMRQRGNRNFSNQGNQGNRNFSSNRGNRNTSSNRGNRGNSGNPNQTTETGSPDMRTTENRERFGNAESFTVDDINPDEIRWDRNGESVDLRTLEGRALLSEGMVDDQGFPTDSFPQEWLQFEPSNNRNSSNNSNRGNRGNRSRR